VADSSAIYAALSAKLTTDVTLMALTTDGAYRDIAPAGTTKVIIISKQADSRVYVQDRQMAYEAFSYLVKAVVKATSGTVASQAASRIRALLHNAQLVVAGYGLMSCHLSEDEGAIEYQESDPDDTDARWQHRGWIFDVIVSPV
jgi:hypothetical protein